MELRINRFLAQCGLGSRRAVEALVRDGRVECNGRRVTDLSLRVDSESDEVRVDGQVVRARFDGRVILLHKPVGVVSSLVRQDQRRCLLDLLPAEWKEGRLFHVGRLDHDSSGLLLLSDDGDLAHALTHPRHPVWKTYEVVVRPPLSAEGEATFRDGRLEIDGRACLPARLQGLAIEGDRARYLVQLREGRNRQIRRMFEALGAVVLALHRTGFGPVELGDLAPGRSRLATPEERRRLRASGDDRAIDAPEGPA